MGGDNIGKATHKSFKIKSKNNIVYVKASMWGLTGDHIEIIFSPYPFESEKFDSSTCIKYFEPTVYYKTEGDTLVLYPTMKGYKPPVFISNLKIKEVVINNLNDIQEYKAKYKEFGLGKISVYE